MMKNVDVTLKKNVDGSTKVRYTISPSFVTDFALALKKYLRDGLGIASFICSSALSKTKNQVLKKVGGKKMYPLMMLASLKMLTVQTLERG